VGEIMLDETRVPKINNRNDRRRYSKVLQKKGVSKLESDKVVKMYSIYNKKQNDILSSAYKNYLVEGEKVKLNTNKIMRHPDYQRLVQEYREFVENNTNTIFTVVYDNKDKENDNKPPHLICFEEDSRDKKWLFWDGDLLVFDEKDGEFKEMYNI
jgi:hypothetical protein